jgi:hypothetical protein
MTTNDYDTFSPTRYRNLGIARHGRYWFMVDTSEADHAAKIGDTYRTKAECLAEVRYEADARGYKLA